LNSTTIIPQKAGNNKVKAALSYTEKGKAVVPLHNIKNGKCTCEAGEKCDKPGKHARAAWKKYQEETPSAEQVKEWWEKWPEANIGLITGRVSGVVVLDIDQPEGMETIEELSLDLPATLVAETGSGGFHYYFKSPEKPCQNFTGKYPGIDFRGDGGLAVVPPSENIDGEYSWVMKEELAEIPEWIKKALNSKSKGSKLEPEAWSKEVKEGTRNAELTRRAGSLIGKGYSPQEWGKIIPLKTEINPPQFPVGDLPEWLKDYVEAISSSLQVPPDLPAVAGLACLSTALAGKYQVTLRYGWNEPCNLYTVVILPPAERKSAVMSAMTKPIYEYEEQLAKEQGPDHAEQLSKKRMVEKRLQEGENAAAKAGVMDRAEKEAEALNAARELQELEIPCLPRLAVSDISPEKMANLLAEQKGRLAVLSAEGTLFEVIAGRYSNSPNLDTILQAHSGDPIRVDRVGRAADIINNPALTIGLTVQPFVLSGLMDNPFFKGRGLLARFLYFIPSPMVGRRNPNPPPLNEEVEREYRQRLTRLLQIEREEPQDIILSPGAAKESAGLAEYLESLLANEESFIRQGDDEVRQRYANEVLTELDGVNDPDQIAEYYNQMKQEGAKLKQDEAAAG